MTIQSTNITTGPYIGNGQSANYDFDFPIKDGTEIQVFQTTNVAQANPVELVLNSDYTIVINNDGLGVITLLAGNLPVDHILFMRLNISPTQETAFSSQGGFFPDVHESAFDKLTRLVQQSYFNISRKMGFSDSYSGSASLVLPDPEPGKGWRWNSDATALESITLNDNGSFVNDVTFTLNPPVTGDILDQSITNQLGQIAINTQLITQENLDRVTAITQEATTRASAITQEATTRASEIQAATAAAVAANNAQQLEIGTISQSAADAINTANAAQSSVSTVASDLQTLDGTVTSLSTTVGTTTTAATNAGTTATTALSQSQSAISRLDDTGGNSTNISIETLAANVETLENAIPSGGGATVQSVQDVNTRVDTLQGEVDTNASTLTTVESTANLASNNATTALTDAANAQTSVDSLGTTVNSQGSDISSLTSSVTAVQNTANTASTNSSSALSLAQDAANAANAATVSANNAITAVSTAQSNIDTVEGTLSTQGALVSSLQSDVASAQSTANSAVSSASTAQSEVDVLEGTVSTLVTSVSGLQSSVTTAQSTADAANVAVATAQTSADDAQGDVDSLSSTVSSLSSTIGTANTNASAAVSTANAAQVTANDAETTANSTASSLSTVQTNVSGLQSSVGTQATAIADLENGVGAQWEVKATAAGVTGAIGLYNKNGNVTVKINADSIDVTDPDNASQVISLFSGGVINPNFTPSKSGAGLPVSTNRVGPLSTDLVVTSTSLVTIASGGPSDVEGFRVIAGQFIAEYDYDPNGSTLELEFRTGPASANISLLIEYEVYQASSGARRSGFSFRESTSSQALTNVDLDFAQYSPFVTQGSTFAAFDNSQPITAIVKYSGQVEGTGMTVRARKNTSFTPDMTIKNSGFIMTVEDQ